MLRALAKQLANHGRRVFEGILQKGEHGIKANPRNKDLARFGPEHQRTEGPHARYFVRVDASSKAGHATWVQRLTGSSGKSFVQNLRSKTDGIFQNATNQLQGRSQELVTGRKLISLYALVGLYMKAGSQEIELEDEQFDHICQEIKTLMGPVGKQTETELTPEEIQLSDLQLGPLIAKGSNSAVYCARLCSDKLENDDDEDLPSFEVISEEESSDFSVITDEDLHDINQDWQTRSDITIWDNYWEDVGTPGTSTTQEPQDQTMNLAVKMMFNYDAESDSDAILRAMQNETVPAKTQSVAEAAPMWENGNRVKKKELEPHPNVVNIKGVFIDEVPDLPDALSLYPDALPARLNPEGFGHNKTMFLVMKRYDSTLRGYLERHTPSLNESLFLLAQLLEAVNHLSEQQVAHRDLKSDNILVDTSNLDLVVSDFGCCLADEEFGMKIPYSSRYTDKGGNVALMAPEISCAEPGYGVVLDYSKSDLWTVGAIAYEIFGCDNPFYRTNSGVRLDSRMYTLDDLPSLPDYVPSAIRALIKSILSKNPSERPSASEAANLIHLHLWAPDGWLSPGYLPSKLDLTRWLLLETAGVMCHRSWIIQTNPLLTLKQCFLARSSIGELLKTFRVITSRN